MPSQCLVTGHLQDITGVPGANAQVVFTLENVVQEPARIIGSYVLVPVAVTVNADGSGNISVNIWGNDNITPSGTYYAVRFAGSIVGYWQFTGASADLDTQAQITASPVVTPPTGDATYLRLDGGNKNSLAAGLQLGPWINGPTQLTQSAATITFALNTNTAFVVTLTQNATIAFTNIAVGQLVAVEIVQNASAPYTVTWPSNVFGGADVGTTLGGRNVQLFYSPDGTNLLALGGMNANL